MHAAAQIAVEHVRSGKGPFFLELCTYRYRGHSMSDSGAYRAKEEVEEWAKRDPINILRDRLINAGELTPDDFTAMNQAIHDELENEIIPYAENAPEPKLEELEKYVLAENDPYVNPQGMGGAH